LFHVVQLLVPVLEEKFVHHWFDRSFWRHLKGAGVGTWTVQLPIGWQHPLALGWEEEKSTHRKAIFSFGRKHLGGLGPRTAGLG